MTVGWLYRATVRHARREPLAHEFTSAAIYVQIDVEAAAASRLRLFGVDRLALAMVRSRDYLGGGNAPLRSRLARWLPGIDRADSGERVYLLTTPRVLGYAFQPVSVFQCVAPSGQVTRGLVEVHNTFGEAHVYPLPHLDDAGRASFRKEFFVSPFFGVDGEYVFRTSPPGPHLRVSVQLVRNGSPSLQATLFGEGIPLSDGALMTTLARAPLTAALTYPRIAWQGQRLRFQRGLVPRMRPKATSERTVLAAPPSGRRS